jgi:hypothetical protein
MQRGILGLASAAVAAASCLVVLQLLRDPPPAAPAPAREPARVASVAAAPPPRPTAGDGARLAEAARAAEAEEQALRDAMLRIGEDEGLPLDARLERYRQGVAAARPEGPSAFAFDEPSVLTEAFLRNESVQRELAALHPSARSRELAHIRRELGYGEDEIARAEALDERREARWQNGLAYMEERAHLGATFEGAALDAELRALREEYFAHEAPTIEAEEKSGFYRFERPRVYGRN